MLSLAGRGLAGYEATHVVRTRFCLGEMVEMNGRPTSNLNRRQALKGAGVLGGIAAVGWLGWSVFTDDETRARSAGTTRGSGGAAQASQEPDLDALAESAVSGGPSKDGIPSIDEPRFVSVSDATFLSGDEPVFGLVRGGEVRAYPQQVLVWHEIVNDTIGDERIAVTYCPLTGTVVGFTGLPDRPGLTFGTTGRLVNSNLLMYDRETDSEWPQILGTAISGELYGQRLRTVGLVWSSWRAWRALHPQTTVLSTDTGTARSYGTDPYGSYREDSGYYADGGPIFSVRYDDDRFPAKDVVIGVSTRDRQLAIHQELVRRERTVRAELGSARVRADWDAELGSARVEVSGDDGEHTVMDAMWFAWYAFYPKTEVMA